MFGGGFGQNTQQSSGFGSGNAFGSANTGGGFGSSSSPAFGSGNSSGGGLFGNTSSSFGSGGGFGTNTQTQSNSLFGAGQNRTGGFGTAGPSTGGGLFGSSNTSNTGNTGFGGFGSAANTGGGFGSSTGGGGLFGANKPASGFGSTTGTTGFGASGGTSGFGSGTTAPAFGGGSGTAFNQAVPPSDGTGSTPFTPFTEKDAASSVTNHYQSIVFMQPYSKYSFEELRLGDYNGGRRFGNGSGQAGAFGASAFGGSGFGTQSTGFGSGNTSSPFGANTSTPSAFGSQTQTAGGFGSNTSNPLFGAQKPANSLFGGGTSTATTTQSGLFGSNTATAGGFGSKPLGTPQGSTGFGAGSTLFGNTANNNQPQQGQSLFGGGSTGGSAFGGFGTQNTSTASPFGGTTATASPFGGQNQQQQSSGGLFGGGTGFGQQNQAQNQAQTPNKGLFGGFGANTQQQQNSTSGLFGSSNTATGTGTTGGSLFGQNQQTQQPAGGGLFGTNSTTQPAQTNSLFGGGQQQGQKSLFGGGTTGTGTGTSAFGGFGNTQTQQTGGGSGLFGGGAAQQQQKPSLFGGAAPSGGSLFGGGASTTTPAATGSLFGGATSQNQQPTTLGSSSLFGGSQSQATQQMGPAPGSLQASLLDGNPYGNQSIFSGLPAPSTASPGPLATPLSSSNKQKQRTPLPVYKITPTAANRLLTPPKRGYGFSYSTYGSPSSTANTPGGLGGSVLGGSMRSSFNASSLGRSSFSKSLSTSNLRKTFDPEGDSVLSPGALSSGSSRLSSGSLKRLTIDRSLRNDLFTRSTSTPPPAAITNGEVAAPLVDKGKKKVSFESSSDLASTGGEIVPVETQSPEPTAEELGFLRSVRKSGTINGVNGTKSPENAARPEMESVRNNDAPAVTERPEPSATNTAPKRLAFVPGGDPQPGEYYMRPTRAELSRMSREQLKKVEGFTVGRENCGEVTFDKPVDLTTIDLDNIFGGLVDIDVRKITVYPDETIKPPRGKGLNVPSILRIENSWPRGRDKKSPSPLTSGPLFDKHIDRLVKVHNTEFIDYEAETGTWVFKVPHFTTYGLDYDSDEEEEGESLNQSTLSAAPDTPTPKAQTLANPDNTVGSEQLSAFSTDDSFLGSVAGVDDDTFDFKKRKIVPGAFGHQAMETMNDEHSGSEEEEDDSFLGDGSTGSTIEPDGDDITESLQSGESEVEFDESEEMDMAGTFPDLRHTVEHDDTASTDTYMEDPRLSLKPWNTPAKPRLDLTGDWAEQLQRTISPRKQNRDALREIQAHAFNDRSLHEETPKQPTSESKKKGFATSIDLMNSLFQQPRKHQTTSPSKAQNARPKGPEWPYHKQPKTYAGESNELSADDLAFHHSFKPRWGPGNSLLCVRNSFSPIEAGLSRWDHRLSVTSEGRDVSLLSYSKVDEPISMLDAQRDLTIISPVDGIVPFARLVQADFYKMSSVASGSPSVSDQERLLWQLTNVLFNEELDDDISAGVPPELRSQFSHRIKKDRLTRLLEGIIRQKQVQKLGQVGSPEERAVHLLCAHRVDEACTVLLSSQNPHLATLVSQIGRDATVREDITKQIEMWRQTNAYSEMSEPVRALYELLAGNALRSEGKTTGALEDRISAFTFSERFGLDWFQAFGLRLWYGISEDEPLENAVCKFVDDLNSGIETALPSPDLSQLHQSTTAQDRESPLWVLLKVYAAATGAGQDSQFDGLEFPGALLPESVTGDRLTNRLTFQLCQFLAAAVGHSGRFQLNVAQMDQLTWDYAWELCGFAALPRSIFVLCHLSRTVDRERAIKDMLARFAPTIPDSVNEDGSPNNLWRFLITEARIPENWIWVAKALDARDRGDAAHEVDYLVRAKNWNDAHTTFCRIVGPSAVIEGDYATLETLVSGFGAEPERKVRGWAQGGGVYDDFLQLATARAGRRDPARLHRLVQALVQRGDQIRQGSGVEGLEERVAFREMSRAVARWTAYEDIQATDLSSVLSLPLTGDARLTQTAEMSRRYYGVIMAGGY
ncbi:uncharacterized protein BP01DRAFT_365748 [Aspergillus saccharolyticus JOP 1030-1]|uniref:Peptidase S59 domain-containing protein n=1 Tax=Aspergillus saccharolyticus JOP 1030-1 TaxID=1450539 RepID=A0A318ZG00_9EURO|nr:hypothetical protein BP01DRAFT_365748 [Aspergillus saccharolyticus JOP 1030-1]PYH45274.1 hypothetical protein BP01DRAFT_365748 [Aspergillus saccharolyticus JOP 1030-1]